MKTEKQHPSAAPERVKREKLISYDNARTCLFKNLRAIFLFGHENFAPIIGKKFDDMPVRFSDDGEGYIISFNTERYSFTEQEAEIYQRATTIMINETHALLTKSPELQKIIGVQPLEGKILISNEEALFVLVKGLCHAAPSILDMDDTEYYPDELVNHERRDHNPSFSLNQTVSISTPLPTAHFNRRETNYTESGGQVMPFAMRDIDSFMRQSNLKTRAPLSFAIH